jgi:hypothetical protein
VVLLTLLRTAPKRAAFLANIDMVIKLLLSNSVSQREQKGETRGRRRCGRRKFEDVLRFSGVVVW